MGAVLCNGVYPDFSIPMQIYGNSAARVSRIQVKKKMTQTEFQKWADYAIVLRNKALNGDVDYDDYVREMKK